MQENDFAFLIHDFVLVCLHNAASTFVKSVFFKEIYHQYKKFFIN